jgi:hypothetical protein
VVTIFTAKWSLYVPSSGHYMYRTVVTICTASGHYMYHQFYIKILRSAHTVYLRVLCGSDNKPIISLYSINWLVLITEKESVYCAVRTGYLNVFQVNFVCIWHKLKIRACNFYCWLPCSSSMGSLLRVTAVDWYTKWRQIFKILQELCTLWYRHANITTILITSYNYSTRHLALSDTSSY